MEGREVMISTGIVIFVLVIGVLALDFLICGNKAKSSGMKWGIQEDRSFSYIIHVDGYKRYYSSTNYTDYPTPFDYLNRSVLDIQIETLPPVNKSFTELSFIEEVVEFEKTSIVATFTIESATRVFDDEVQFLNQLISKAFMPIDAWNTIDALYPDSITDMYQCDMYHSREGDSFFVFGYRYYDINAGTSWNATISQSSGVPLVLSWLDVKNYGSEQHVYDVSLTLTDIA